jgi:hypothetical protein
MMHKVIYLAMTGIFLAASGGASAQDWGYGRASYVDRVCSDERAHRLEYRLQHEWEEGEIGGDTAHRIHRAIDRLEDRQRHECEEGDDPAIARIADGYDRIDGWIDNAAHGGWRPGW